jgi:cation diffusion facilitator CzcD-associated flavoprotein CzcO
MNTDHFDTVVIGGGQAGPATGRYLKTQGRDLVPRRGA